MSKIKQKHPKITKEDAIIICSYTREIKGKYHADSPYKILNQSMTSENRNKGIQNVGQYLLVLLLALRKLEKCYKDCLYRGIRTNVIKDKDTKGNEYKYKKGDIKKWWAFTSTSYSKEVALNFLKDTNKYGKHGTIFEIKGSELWGYDLSDFNMFPEKEILFIPEREIEIKDIKQIDDYALIECRMLTDSSLILEDCNECPNCGSLDVERTNKVEEIDFGGLEGIFKDIFNNEQQKNFISDQLLKSFNRVNDKKYKCTKCSHEYELSHK